MTVSVPAWRPRVAVCCVHCGHTEIRDGNLEAVFRLMRERGWYIDKLRMFRCPDCAKRGKAR